MCFSVSLSLENAHLKENKNFFADLAKHKKKRKEIIIKPNVGS